MTLCRSVPYRLGCHSEDVYDISTVRLAYQDVLPAIARRTDREALASARLTVLRTCATIALLWNGTWGLIYRGGPDSRMDTPLPRIHDPLSLSRWIVPDE